MPTNRSNAESTTLSEVLPEQGVAFHDAETPFQAILCKPKLLPIKSFSLERLEKLEKKIQQEMQQRREEEKHRRQQQNSWGTASRAHHPAVVGAAPVLRPVLGGAAANPSFPPASAEVAQRRKQQQSQPQPQSTPAAAAATAAAAAGPLVEVQEEGLDGGGRIASGGVVPGLLSVEGLLTPPLSVPVPLTPKAADSDAPRTPPPAMEVVESSTISGWSKKSLPFVPGGRSEEEEIAAASMTPSPFSPGAPAMSSESSNSSPQAGHAEGPSPPFPCSPTGSITSSGRSSNHVAAQPPLALMPPPRSQPASSPSRGHPPTTVHKSRRAKVTSVPPEDQ